jgi:aerotaxis receptor
MRNNTPVTDVEILLSDAFAIVSTTDLQGNITYANPYFVEISGFQSEELIGAPQNILRHPDMPKEAFADMWATIKSGTPWTGMVKNRTKQGNYYWVLANVTPVYERGQPVGYMSVRTKPSRDAVAQTAKVYQEINAGNPRNLRVVQGQIEGGGWRALKTPSLLWQLRLSALLVVLALGVLGVNAGGWLAGVAALGAAAAIYLMAVLNGRVFQPLKRLTHSARVMAGGDLTQALEPAAQDDFGQLQNALRQMSINLSSIIGDVRSNFENIRIATNEIASGNMDLSGRTESQASSLEQTAASMEELNGTVKQSASNAKHANALADRASEVATQSSEVVGQVAHTMQAINAASGQISDIIGLIDGIAFQTNILALNAAVEAARAGEQGRGFAVVASEVRALAQRSAAAAKEIKGLIDTTLSRVEGGMTQSTGAGTAMQEVLVAIQQVNVIVSEISDATREQSLGITQVTQAVSQLDTVTQQNAALVEEAAAAAASLHDQTERLTNALAVFKVPAH